MRLPLDPHADDAAGRERRLTIIGFCKGHWEQREEFTSNGRVQWFRAPEGGYQSG